MLKVVEVPDASQAGRFAEMGLVYPVPGEQPNTITFEARDGANIQQTVGTGVVSQLGGQTTFQAHRVDLQLYVTDARIAFACSKYNAHKRNPVRLMGPGSLGLNLIMTGVTKAAAARQRQGRSLVGQIRYPWLTQVGSTPAAGRRTAETLYLEAPTEKKGTLRLTITLPDDVRAAEVAADIARRAACYRLVSLRTDGAMRAHLEATMRTGAYPPGGDPTAIAWHQIPGADLVGERSARLAPVAA